MISTILYWDSKSYIIHVILPRLSREDCTLVVFKFMQQSRHLHVKVTSLFHVTSQRIQELLGAFLKHENAAFNGEQEKESVSCVRVIKEKSVPWDHHLSSLGKPHDAKR